MGFGGGAMVAAPLDSYLLSYYSSPPTLLGGIDQVQVVTEGGVRMAESGTPVRRSTAARPSSATSLEALTRRGLCTGGQMVEVIVATAADVAGKGLEEGVCTPNRPCLAATSILALAPAPAVDHSNPFSQSP